jgi:hypothetical protein
VDGVSNDWGVDSVVDWCVDSVVDGGVDSVVDWGVHQRSVMGNSVSYRGDGVEGSDSSLASWHDPVGSNGGLDLSKTLGVVHLGHGGVSGSESLGLDQTPLFTVCGGDRLVGGLASSDSVVDDWGVVSEQDRTGRGGAAQGKKGEADKGLHVA